MKPGDNIKVIGLTTIAMIAFAGNSLLCRAALDTTNTDAASFTMVRLLSGAITLYLIVKLRNSSDAGSGNWISAFALFAYAAAFSFAYLLLPAGTGALILFGAVQVTMISHGLAKGESLTLWQIAGLLLALGGLVGLLLPGLSAPSVPGSVLMLGAGVAWGVYSLRGKGSGDPTRVTAGNFLRAVPLSAVLLLVMFRQLHIDPIGVALAIASGAAASGIGYAIWYSALPHLRATSAASVQLVVPVIAAASGTLLLGEALTLRLVLAAAAILGGIALVIQTGSADQA